MFLTNNFLGSMVDFSFFWGVGGAGLQSFWLTTYEMELFSFRFSSCLGLGLAGSESMMRTIPLQP